MKRLIAFLLILCGFAFSEIPDFLSQPSKKELYAKARDLLKVSLENGDLAKAGEALEYLQANVGNGAPLQRFEEYLILTELNRYDEAITAYAHLRRFQMDPDYKVDEERRLEANDALNTYLYRNLSPFNKEKIDSLYQRALQSEASKENKDLYGMLLYSEQGLKYHVDWGLTYSNVIMDDTTCTMEFLKRAKDFIYNYPMSEHTPYLKNHVIPTVQEKMDDLHEFERNPWSYKYYTGGLAIFAGKWTGFVNGLVTNYLDTEMGTSFILEAEIQISRISLDGYMGIGMVSRPKGKFIDVVRSGYWEGDQSEEDVFYGLSLGYTFYESRFVKITPFIGFGLMEYTLFDWDNFPQWNLGVNVDSHLWMSRLERKYQASWGIVLRLKYMIQFGELSEKGSNWWSGSDFPKTRARSINHLFALELGLFTW